jgi:DNA-binding winged helix-turn-helix (wHTH) protein/Tol biopolymer transport system component
MSGTDTGSRRRIRFGLYELDLVARELRREGVVVKLQERPFEVLAILVENPGEVITRDAFRQRLWPADTFVDFDASLNTSVNKLRQALQDNAENPRFIATSGRRGYRFIAPASVQEAIGPDQAPEAGSQADKSRWRIWAYGAAGVCVLALAVIWVIELRRPEPVPKVLDLVQITRDGMLDPWGKLTTDGARIFYLDHAGNHWTVMQAPASGGDAQQFLQPAQNTRIVDISPDRASLLSFTFFGRSNDLPLWLTPIVGGSPTRVGDVVADDAAFSKDGRRVFFNRPDGIYSCERDGTGVKKLVALTGRSEYLQWSRDGQRLRFTVDGPGLNESAIWEVASDGKNLHEVNLNLPQPGSTCCGRWSNDGRYFFFTFTRNDLHSIWAIREDDRTWLSRPARPVQLTFGPNNSGGLIASADDNRVFVWSGNEQFEVARYYPASGRIQPLLPGIYSLNTRLSPDGAWVTFTAGGGLWRTRADGSMRQSLVSGFSVIDQVEWSPDSTHLLFHAVDSAKSDKFFVVPTGGGPPTELALGAGRNEPLWSPDGKSIYFSRWATDGGVTLAQSGIYLLDLHTSALAKVPGSEGLVHPRFSPDHRFLAAVTNFDQNPTQPVRVLLFDTQTRRWREISQGRLVNPVAWSKDSKDFYYQDLLADGQPAFRFSTVSNRSEQFITFESLLHAGYARCSFLSFAPDGSLAVSLRRNEVNVYRLDLDLP